MAMTAATDTDEKVIGQDDRAPAPEPAVGTAEPRSPAEPGDEKGELAVEAFARDHEDLTEDDEQDALDFLLAPKPARVYSVPVQYDTEKGLRPLKFVVKAMDGRKIDSIEQANVSEATGKIDRITADCQIVGEALQAFETERRSVEPTSTEFLTVQIPKREADGTPTGEKMPHTFASAADAIEARFKTQLGLVSGVAREVRRISGYDPERVGMAQRRLVTAAGNS